MTSTHTKLNKLTNERTNVYLSLTRVCNLCIFKFVDNFIVTAPLVRPLFQIVRRKTKKFFKKLSLHFPFAENFLNQPLFRAILSLLFSWLFHFVVDVAATRVGSNLQLELTNRLCWTLCVILEKCHIDVTLFWNESRAYWVVYVSYTFVCRPVCLF